MRVTGHWWTRSAFVYLWHDSSVSLAASWKHFDVTGPPATGRELVFCGRAATWTEGLLVAAARSIRLLAGIVFLFAVLVPAAQVALGYASADIAYALSGWVEIASSPDDTGLLAVSAWLVLVAAMRRRHAPRLLQLQNGMWCWVGLNRVPLPAFAAGSVLQVRRLPAAAAWILTTLPCIPRPWRPLAGSLNGWLAVRVRGQAWCVLPCQLPVSARIVLLQARSAAPIESTSALRRAVAWAVGLVVPVLVALPLAAAADILGSSSHPYRGDYWISELPARLVLLQLNPGELPSDSRTALLRKAVVAGNPRVVTLLLDASGQEAETVSLRRLARNDCFSSLSELSTTEDPPEGITRAQRAAKAAELQQALQPFERRARADLPTVDEAEDELQLMAMAAELATLCEGRKPPYWQGEWSIQALWPKDAQGALRQPQSFTLANGGSAGAFELAIQVGALNARKPVTRLEETPLMLVLGELRRQRARAEGERKEFVEADLQSAVQVLTENDRSDLQAKDAADRSIAWLAAAAGEGQLMRRAVTEGGPAALNARTGMGSTLLHGAAIGGLADDVDWLLQQGLSARESDLEGRTPAQVALDVEVARRLAR